MSEVTARPEICLNMIVRNEAHIVHEVLDSVAPYITSWVIVDTGSDDGTQDVIRSHMASLGIPGELHERPWRNFGHNRSEALTLAQGHGDYIWVIDADDTVVGTPDFSGLSADVYNLRYGRVTASSTGAAQLFRDGLRWRYEGVVHEYAVCDDPFVEERLDGEYYIESRRLGARNLDPQKYARDRDLLLAEVERNPDDARSVFYLAQSYFDLGDFVNAREWYARRVDMGGWDEEVYCAMFRVAESMSQLGAPWPDVQDAYLRAWEFRPTRAEPLHAIAYRYRDRSALPARPPVCRARRRNPVSRRGHIVCRRRRLRLARDRRAVGLRILDRQACEAFMLCRRLLARPDIPDDDRQRIAGNRDFSAPTMIDAALSYPDALVQRLIAGPRDSEVIVSLVAGPDRGATEQMLNSFLNCCARCVAGRALPGGRCRPVSGGSRDCSSSVTGSSSSPFRAPADGPGAQLAQVRAQIDGRFWLHLGQGWRFFAPENFITRLTAVLEAEPQVFQVGDQLRRCGQTDRRLRGREARCAGPPMPAATSSPTWWRAARRCSRPHAWIGRAVCDGTDRDPIAELGRRAAAAGLRTASLDEVLCIAGV